MKDETKQTLQMIIAGVFLNGVITGKQNKVMNNDVVFLALEEIEKLLRELNEKQPN